MTRWLFICGLVAYPSWSWACALCLAENEESRMAFIGTTILLTVIPLAVIGGTVRWAVKKAEENRIADEQEALDRYHRGSESSSP